MVLRIHRVASNLQPSFENRSVSIDPHWPIVVYESVRWFNMAGRTGSLAARRKRMRELCVSAVRTRVLEPGNHMVAAGKRRAVHRDGFCLPQESLCLSVRVCVCVCVCLANLCVRYSANGRTRAAAWET